MPRKTTDEVRDLLVHLVHRSPRVQVLGAEEVSERLSLPHEVGTSGWGDSGEDLHEICLGLRRGDVVESRDEELLERARIAADHPEMGPVVLGYASCQRLRRVRSRPVTTPGAVPGDQEGFLQGVGHDPVEVEEQRLTGVQRSHRVLAASAASCSVVAKTAFMNAGEYP